MNIVTTFTFITAKSPIRSMWTCSNCGAPNTVSQDEGCTSCDF